MNAAVKTAPFEEYTDRYESWFERHPAVLQSEINALRQHMPDQGIGIEVGIGTGRYAKELGISEGVEPAANMRAVAVKRGLKVIDAVGEDLPYKALQFDFVLMVTLCHFNDVRKVFKEAFRVLKPGGAIITGILDRDRPVASSYEARRAESHFYKNATFHSVQEVEKALQKAGFRALEFSQTLFHLPGSMSKPDQVEEGYGKGSYVVIRGSKPS